MLCGDFLHKSLDRVPLKTNGTIGKANMRETPSPG